MRRYASLLNSRKHLAPPQSVRAPSDDLTASVPVRTKLPTPQWRLRNEWKTVRKGRKIIGIWRFWFLRSPAAGSYFVAHEPHTTVRASLRSAPPTGEEESGSFARPAAVHTINRGGPTERGMGMGCTYAAPTLQRNVDQKWHRGTPDFQSCYRFYTSIGHIEGVRGE
ncbi:unnamed protein product [Pleuronectes platessa]|uniref:Uncharacterized protein n=1 Tax=Pleuronectes platessa TaxID=8262 RepID=A0A9N7U1N1_PLEPL|nr:unnamed protein product [Pleuronectes platessa]